MTLNKPDCLNQNVHEEGEELSRHIRLGQQQPVIAEDTRNTTERESERERERERKREREREPVR